MILIYITTIYVNIFYGHNKTPFHVIRISIQTKGIVWILPHLGGARFRQDLPPNTCRRFNRKAPADMCGLCQGFFIVQQNGFRVDACIVFSFFWNVWYRLTFVYFFRFHFQFLFDKEREKKIAFSSPASVPVVASYWKCFRSVSGFSAPPGLSGNLLSGKTFTRIYPCLSFTRTLRA